MNRSRWLNLVGWVLLAGLAASPPLYAGHAAADPPPAPTDRPATVTDDTQVTPPHGNAEADGPAEAASNAPGADAYPEPEEVDQYVGWLKLSGQLRDGPLPYAWLGPQETGVSLTAVVAALQEVETDPDYIGVAIYLDAPVLSMTQCEEIIHAIGRVRAAGKKVLAFAEQYDLRTYLIACAADRVLLQDKGFVELSGLGIEEMYLAGLLEKIGVKADLLQVGRFKGANEQLTRAGPSDAWNQNIDAVLDDLYDHLIDLVADGRRISRAQVEQVLADCWSMTDTDYVERGLVDDLTDRSLTSVTGPMFGDEFYWSDLLDTSGSPTDYENPFALFRALFHRAEPRVQRDSLAVVHLSGPIVMGNDGGDDPFGGDVIDTDVVMSALDEAMDEPRIKGVVLRLDSPGGSALASELIWQTVRELGQDKPVYVSVGPMAASGGYYIASATDLIFVSPTSIVGSIGVVGGKLALGGLYEKIGVAVHRRSRGPLADMFNSVEPFTPEQRTALSAAFKRVYEQFTDRVTTGRGDRLPDVAPVAEGRLFTGRQAVRNGLADRIGGLKTAIEALARETGLQEGAYDIVDLPHPQTLAEFLGDLFRLDTNAAGCQRNAVSGAGAALATAKAVLGPRRWRAVRPILSGLLQLRTERVLTLMPTALLVP